MARKAAIKLIGPESIPLREYVKSFLMVVTIYDIKTDKPIREETIDYGNATHRQWLGKVTFWACSNGHSVETMSLTDFESDDKKD